MRKKVFAIVLILCVSGISVTLALTYKMWGAGFLPGTLKVSAYLKTPIVKGGSVSVETTSVTIGVKSNNQKIGESGTEIQLISGHYTLSFEDYSAEYETPQEQTVFVKPYETTHITIGYLAKFGYVVVYTEAHNAYYQNSSSIDAEVFIDGESKGFGTVIVRLNSSETPYVVSFSDIEGYTTPQNQTVTIGNCDVIEITGTYEENLTPEQKVYVDFRDNMIIETINPDSNLFTYARYVFYKNVLDERKTDTQFFTMIRKEGYSSGYVSFQFATYVGIFEQDRVNAAIELSQSLLTFGIEVTGKDFVAMRYEDESEYIIYTMKSFHFSLIEQEESIWMFNETWVDALIDPSIGFVPAGMELDFPDITTVYVVQGNTTPSFEDVYVPPFSRYSNVPSNYQGWVSFTFWPSDFHRFIKSLRLMR